MFWEKYELAVTVRASMGNYKEEDGLVGLPLYAVGLVRGL